MSTLLGFGAGLLANLATSGWTWSVGVGLLVLVAAWAGFEGWRAGQAERPTGGTASLTSGRLGGAGAVEGDRRQPWMAQPLDRMVERPELADRLMAVLMRPDTADVGVTTGLHGVGGFGKTTLTAWVCHRPEIAARFTGGLLWASVGQEVHGVDLAERVNDLVWVLSGQRPAISDPDAAGAELGRLLDEQRGPVLLVVDDVWEESQLRPFRFGGRACVRLVTTRIPGLLPPGTPSILVDAMSAAQARQLVSHGVGGLPPAAAGELADLAGRWPVLLNLLNGVLRRRVAGGQSPTEAAEHVRRELLAHGPVAFDPARPADRSRAVAATVEASLALLTADDLRRYLDLAVFPEDVDIPLDVLELLWPGTRVDRLCEELYGLGLVADYRLDPPEPRLVLHDVIRAYLRTRCGAEDRTGVHRRLVTAAAGLLASHDQERRPRPWWTLPPDAGYLWRYLPQHLAEAGENDELAAAVCDLRWVEAKTRRLGSVIGALADLALVNTPSAEALRRVLDRDAPLLGPIDPPDALGATLASRLHAVPELETVLQRYRATLPRPRLEPFWPLPDRPDPARPRPAGHAGVVTGCVFSPDGTVLASISDDATARLWRIADGTEQAVLTGHSGAVWGCAFSPDGRLLATTGDDKTVRLWRVPEAVPYALFGGHRDSVVGCAFSPDGALLATASSDGTARLWRIADGGEQAVLAGHMSGVTGCAFSPDGALLATSSDDGTARLWRVSDGIPQAVLAPQTGGIRGCAFSPNGTMLATAGVDGTVRLWGVPGGEQQAVLTVGHQLHGCAFSPDGTLLATAGLGGPVRLWQATSGVTHAVLPDQGAWVRGCAFSPDGTLLATAGNDQTLRLWSVPDGSPRRLLSNPARHVNGCAFSPDDTLLATTSYDGTARLWHVSTGIPQAVLTGHTSRVSRCAFSPDGTLLATTSFDQSARLWTVPGGALQAVLLGHTDWVRACSFSPDGTLLATASYDHTVRLWQIPDGSACAVLTGHTAYVSGCAFSPDGTLLATTSADQTARICQVADDTERTVLTGHTDALNSCAFSPDGRLLATVSDDRTARLWSVHDGTEVAVLSGHASWVEFCAFSPDGTLLATAGRDHTVRLWHVATGRCHCALRVASAHSGIAWHPDGKLLCAVGGAGIYLLTYTP